MLKLNKDVIFLILEELQEDNKSLYSCLLVNRTWCETTVPILWRNPARQYYSTNNAYSILFNVILLHLSEESRNYLKNQGIVLFMEPYQRPLFNYISFWRHLDLFFLEHMMNVFVMDIVKSKTFIIEDEIFKLFINGNTNFVSLFIPRINPRMFNILGVEHCFSGLEYFHCDDNTNSNILEGLARISTSIEKLRIDIRYNNADNPGIVKLIEGQRNLKDVKFIYNNSNLNNESYRKTLEESLIKCADTIQYLRIDWNPVTNFLSSLVNLVSLDLNLCFTHLILEINWNHLENVSLPVLKILRAQQVLPKILASLIESTRGYLTEISILHQSVDDDRLIQTIYRHCPNLSYLKLSIFTMSLSEFENLLLSCHSLNELEIIGRHNNLNNYNFNKFNWDKLFEMLTKSAPISLFKFKFFSAWKIELESIRFFLDNWKHRYPMLLQLILTKNANVEQLHQQQQLKLKDLIEKYRKIGVIKKYIIDEVLII
jgi:hypothetical protein